MVGLTLSPARMKEPLLHDQPVPAGNLLLSRCRYDSVIELDRIRQGMLQEGTAPL